MNFRLLLGGFLMVNAVVGGAPAADPLLDWSAADRYRAGVTHPAVTFKTADLARAKENLRRYPWAQRYAAGLERSAGVALPGLTPEYLTTMIPETTPGDPKFTPCPACREQGKPVHPHGLWSWTPAAPDRLQCDVCRTVFPHEKYPESIVLKTTWGKPQTLTFCAAEPFVIFGYKTGRPSFAANIRARKVNHMAGVVRTMAEAFLLTGKIEYARGVRAILLRFAEVYPGWLVHSGYGEFADIDPHVAAQTINALPAPELLAPPNRPDGRLHTGYWTAGRANATGMEAGFVRKMVESYDFTCSARDDAGQLVYTATERRKIENDLLLEGTVLLVGDKQINNKSVGNRTAAALVGLCVGHPGLVRFGWEGFQQTVNSWFLPDGTTSESPAYALMTLGGIWDLAQALRGYSDPLGYRARDDTRMDALDPYHGTGYERVWAEMFNSQQGDLLYPPYADSYRTSALGGNFVELMVANYPERPEYLALLKEICGPDLAGGHAPLALYHREPGLEAKVVPPLVLPDGCPPELRIGHMRSGADGRESLLLLSASRWGSHHHEDSLSLYYWKKGGEVLSDLGYLWDHPLKHQAGRTVAHNTVVIDEKSQVTRERGGDVLFFRTSPQVKAMEAESKAYPGAQLYRRTSALIDHGGGRSYVVDFFRVQGGRTQDYVYHGTAPNCEVLDLQTTAAPAAKLYDFSGVRTGDGSGVWRARWRAGAHLTGVAWNVGQPGERVLIADGWGQRDWKNSDIGVTVPYIVRRAEGAGAKVFMSVFEGQEGSEPFVRSVRRIDPAGTLAIETALGTDYVMSRPGSGTLAFDTNAGPRRIDGRLVVASVQNGTLAWQFAETGAK